jgi:RHS repeat-associated protein
MSWLTLFGVTFSASYSHGVGVGGGAVRWRQVGSGWTGRDCRLYSSTLGLHKFGMRWYDQKLQRWTQQDPIDQAGDLREGDRYLYVGGDPINLADPTGQWFGENVVSAVGKGIKRGAKVAVSCLNPVSKETGYGAAIGGGVGFAVGTASAVELGPGAVGVGAISGFAGAAIGAPVGSTYSCAKTVFGS